jgi:steroid delta-isomerase-like uncharacterized protein
MELECRGPQCVHMSIEQNKEQNKKVVTEFIDGLFSQGDMGAVDAYLSEDFVNHDPPFGASADRDGMRAAAAAFRSGFPDWHSKLHLLIAEDDLVAEHFTASGTHRGVAMGVAATGRTVELQGINIFRLRDGRIVERWGRLDDLGFLQQLGVVAPLER